MDRRKRERIHNIVLVSPHWVPKHLSPTSDGQAAVRQIKELRRWINDSNLFWPDLFQIMQNVGFLSLAPSLSSLTSLLWLLCLWKVFASKTSFNISAQRQMQMSFALEQMFPVALRRSEVGLPSARRGSDPSGSRRRLKCWCLRLLTGSSSPEAESSEHSLPSHFTSLYTKTVVFVSCRNQNQNLAGASSWGLHGLLMCQNICSNKMCVVVVLNRTSWVVVGSWCVQCVCRWTEDNHVLSGLFHLHSLCYIHFFWSGSSVVACEVQDLINKRCLVFHNDESKRSCSVNSAAAVNELWQQKVKVIKGWKGQRSGLCHWE